MNENDKLTNDRLQEIFDTQSLSKFEILAIVQELLLLRKEVNDLSLKINDDKNWLETYHFGLQIASSWVSNPSFVKKFAIIEALAVVETSHEMAKRIANNAHGPRKNTGTK